MELSHQLSTKELKAVLVNQNYLSESDWKMAVEYAHEYNHSVEYYLINKNILTKDLLGQAFAEYYDMPYVNIDAYPIRQENIDLLDKNIASEYRLFVAHYTESTILFATDQPEQIDYLSLLSEIAGDRKITIGYALPDFVDAALFEYRMPLQSTVALLLSKQSENAPGVLDLIFDEAITRNVSDIHFEPQQNHVVVRFRIDGVLKEMLDIEHQLYEIIVNRIKVSSSLRIDEHQVAQDGALHYEAKSHAVDMRISIVPVTYGEKIVIRILGEYVRGLALSEIGMSENDQQKVLNAVKKPFGMILVVGPTGSGKTTTLYSLVKLLNRSNVNITTIEDPVEYKIPGVNQIQVNNEKGLNFARGLRSIVRQDPDVILVGEIRDKETAEIAVNAALSGHLVLSTFHANDAATAIPRLLDMGVEPFLLASTLELVVGQRLVRTLKDDRKISKKYSKQDIQDHYPVLYEYINEEEVTLYEAQVDESNKNESSPFKGRTALFEMLSVSSRIEELTMGSPSAKDIWEQAEKDGMKSMFEDGVDKIQLGVTTTKELLRVIQPPKKYEKKES